MDAHEKIRRRWLALLAHCHVDALAHPPAAAVVLAAVKDSLERGSATVREAGHVLPPLMWRDVTTL